MCDCEKVKLELLEELQRAAIIKKGGAFVPMNEILNRIYKIKGLDYEEDNS